MASQSEKFFELFDGQTRVARDAAHSESVDRVVPRNSHDTYTVRHNDMFALANDAEVGLLQRPHSIEVIDAGDLRHVTPPPLLLGRLGL